MMNTLKLSTKATKGTKIMVPLQEAFSIDGIHHAARPKI